MALRPRDYQELSEGRLSAEFTKLVEREVRRIMQTAFRGGDNRGHGTQTGFAPGYGLWKAIVTTTITPASLTSGEYTFGSGFAVLVSADDPDVSNVLTPTDDPVAITNWYVNTGNIAVGIVIWVIGADSRLWLLTADCPGP